MTKQWRVEIVGYCSRGKRQYASRSKAKVALKAINIRRERFVSTHGSLEARVYECPFCGFWHTTSDAGRGSGRA